MMPQANATAAIKRGSLPPQYSGRKPGKQMRRSQRGRLTAILNSWRRVWARNPARELLQAVQVFGTDADRPGQQFILRESEPRVRVVVADAVEGRLRFVIRYSQQ